VEGADQGVEVGQEKGLVVIVAKPNEPKTFKIKLRNVREPEGDEDNDPRNKPKGIVLECLGLAKEEKVFTLHDEKGLTGESGTKLRLKYNLKFRVTVRACSRQIGHYRVPVIVAFYHEMHSQKVGQGDNTRFVVSHMAMELLLKVQTDEMKDLRPTAPFRATKRVRKWNVKETIAGKRTIKDNSEDQLRKVEELGHYLIRADRGKVISSNFQDGDTVGEREELEKSKGLLEDDLGKEQYRERWELLLHCEERQLETDIRHYDMADTMLKFDKVRKLFALEVPGLEENRPSVMKGDKIFIFSQSDKREYEGFVHLIQEGRVLLGFSDKLNRMFVPGMKFDVRFTVSRFPLRNMHRAVVLAKTSGILSTLFPSPALLADSPTLPSIKCYDRKVESNLEQFSAVQHIVAGTSGRCPYLVFGPPGTGKTVTMVEAIKQVAKVSSGCHMLACAPSNTAADLLTERLVQHISKTNIIRLHASSRAVASIPGVVKDVSNVREGKFFYPLLEQLLKYKVIVTTLVTAGRLVSAQFPQDHFTHVFIDESGQATEPETVIAMAGLISSKGQVVMAGDPKQLGPVIRSNMGVKHGLTISLLERLMAMELYSKEYDRRCITKLVKNFRSHKELLTIPKMLYYDDELDACADERMAESCLNFPGLPEEARRKKVPLVFHGVIGQDLKEETSPSFFNIEEVVIVLDYIRQICDMKENKVQPKEIGVITPYRRQVQKIRSKLKKEGWEEVMVGSTEEFQGQERRVIIVSTVRSSPEYVNTDSQYRLGFLANPKRFNVAITRAKSLLVIIGNPHILSQDQDWRSLLDFSLSKGCYTGCSYNQESDEDLDRLETRLRRMLIDESEISRLTRLEEPAWRADF